MLEKEVWQYTSQKIQALQTLPPPAQRSTLARLRRGVGKMPGDLPELWSVLLQGMPKELMNADGEPSYAEWAIYVALTLYALHQQGHDVEKEPMHRSGFALGSAVRRLAEDQQSKKQVKDEDFSDNTIWKRFCCMATASGMPELTHYLRGLVQMMRSEGIPLDYARLAKDLYVWQTPEYAPKIRLRWGQDFYANHPKETKNEKE